VKQRARIEIKTGQESRSFHLLLPGTHDDFLTFLAGLNFDSRLFLADFFIANSIHCWTALGGAGRLGLGVLLTGVCCSPHPV
jgi:hypothetical protein